MTNTPHFHTLHDSKRTNDDEFGTRDVITCHCGAYKINEKFVSGNFISGMWQIPESKLSG